MWKKPVTADYILCDLESSQGRVETESKLVVAQRV